MSFSLGGGSSSNKSSSSQNVWQPQANAMTGMYGNMSNLWGDTQPMFGKMNTMAMGLDPYMQNIMQGAQGGYSDMMGGGAVGDTSDIRAQLMKSMQGSERGSNMGRMYSSIVGGPGNEYIDPMVSAMKTGYQENLDKQMGRGAMDASAMGQGGSSRHAMSDAMLKRGALSDMNTAEMNMRGGAYDKDLAMKMDIARQADTGVQNTQQRYMDMMSQADQSKNAAMGYGSGMQNLGMGSMAPWMQAMNQPWNVMGNYSNMMGAPTVLSSSESKGKGKSFSLAGG